MKKKSLFREFDPRMIYDNWHTFTHDGSFAELSAFSCHTSINVEIHDIVIEPPSSARFVTVSLAGHEPSDCVDPNTPLASLQISIYKPYSFGGTSGDFFAGVQPWQQVLSDVPPSVRIRLSDRFRTHSISGLSDLFANATFTYRSGPIAELNEAMSNLWSYRVYGNTLTLYFKSGEDRTLAAFLLSGMMK